MIMDKEDFEQECFKSFVRWFVEDKHGPGEGGQTYLANLYGCSPQYIHMVINKKKLGLRTINKLLRVTETDRGDALRIGEQKLKGEIPTPTMQATATVTPPEPCPTCNQPVKIADVIEEKHGHVIQQFQDRETALKINEMLVAIEKADRDLYMKLFGKIESAFEDIDDVDTLKKTGTDGLPE
jgi:hypothetical protein